MVETVYGIEAWGQGLLEVLPNGDIGLLDPLTPDRPAVPLPMIVRDLRERGSRISTMACAGCARPSPRPWRR
jgi:arginine decarboxylase-like protein